MEYHVLASVRRLGRWAATLLLMAAVYAALLSPGAEAQDPTPTPCWANIRGEVAIDGVLPDRPDPRLAGWVIGLYSVDDVEAYRADRHPRHLNLIEQTTTNEVGDYSFDGRSLSLGARGREAQHLLVKPLSLKPGYYIPQPVELYGEHIITLHQCGQNIDQQNFRLVPQDATPIPTLTPTPTATWTPAPAGPHATIQALYLTATAIARAPRRTPTPFPPMALGTPWTTKTPPALLPPTGGAGHLARRTGLGLLVPIVLLTGLLVVSRLVVAMRTR